MKKLILFFIISLCVLTFLKAQLKSPGDFLPHQLGEHFTPHHMLVDYFYHAAENSPLVKVIEYGKTNQDRPLLLAFVTSEANHARLEEIRINNLRLAGIEDGPVDTSLSKVITWLSYSVHGNEAAGSESAPHVLFELIGPENTVARPWLENSVVIIDPSINPDGYSRYTHWVRSVSAAENNPDIDDIEHREPWPGGRTNHYLFDLNRDWAWQTQVESQNRMHVYNRWLPHVHADLHEMGHESPYYFAPAAKPYHPYISKWQRQFQDTIGRNHARYFDKEGWLYFTKEVFDLFYPSYGDTYPTFSGGIGMTYEQGGSSRGGRGVKLQNGETLTLKDRMEHHLTTSLSTIEATSVHARKVLEEFQKFYESSAENPVGKYKSFIIKGDASGLRLRSLSELLDKQGIHYGTVNTEKSAQGFLYSTRENGQVTVKPGDMVISAFQSKSVLAQVLLNPDNELEDSLTYDITAWSLPYAYGLEALASTNRIEPERSLEYSDENSEVKEAYAYLIPWKNLDHAKIAAALLKKNISLRYTPKKITYEGREFDPGTLIITRADNHSKGEKLVQEINEILKDSRAEIVAIQSGYAEKGPDLGSGRIDLIKKPKVVTLMGEGVSSNAFGQIKWYFDKVLEYPHSMIDRDRLSGIDLNKYNTLILPDGFYNLEKRQMDKINSWVAQGGKLIVMGRATRNFVDKEGYSLKKFATDEEKKEADKTKKLEDLAARYNHYSERERQFIQGLVPGAIFKLKVDSSHPLGFGLDDNYYSLRTNNTLYPLMVGEANVLIHPKENAQVIGFAGNKIREKLKDTVAFAVESKGRGKVIYMVDNTLFRGFWYNGLFLYSNALFMVN